jgi:hypothetical protein
MNIATFIHTADWHIRDRQYGRVFRGEDRRKAVLAVTKMAIDRKVDFIINGGDTFEVNRPSEKNQALLFEVHHMLLEAGIPMYTVTGNHDASDPSYLTFPGYTADKAGLSENAGVVCIDNRVIEHNGIRIAGFPAAVFPDELGERVRQMIAGGNTPDIVVWHGAVKGMVPFEMAGSWDDEEIPYGVKAWLLGDIHLRGRKRLTDQALLSYPGTIDLQDRGEPAKKFIDLYTLPEDFRSRPFPEPEELKVPSRPVVYLSVATDAEADQALAKVRQTVEDNGCGALVFLRYARTMRDVVPRIQAALPPNDSFFGYAPFHRDMDPASRTILGSARQIEKPTLEGLAGEMVGSPRLRGLVTALVPRGANARQLLAEFVSATLTEEIK